MPEGQGLPVIEMPCVEHDTHGEDVIDGQALLSIAENNPNMFDLRSGCQPGVPKKSILKSSLTDGSGSSADCGSGVEGVQW